ncbi:outer membrane protein assembly factor BamE [Luteolibacter sp. SL250]|uniref:outer membrane protein assembly factor BamE domain-containing protein n=1 Tax=Luteolibacter sp. SL250 TaxID=2995170 RepID=UPI0022721F16|nr:outer membrane protein assembly factor BamE [Luteolibacter sp. SL250]WAC18113.1 outer membrane protein assembly factor BamE [Luteolibacter sp. SL250]
MKSIPLIVMIGRSLALGGMAMSIVSCMVSTDPAAYGRMAQQEVKKGMTKDQVTEILGWPHGTSTRNGHESWIYQKRNSLKMLAPGGLAGRETHTVTVRFSPSGRVESVDNAGHSTRWGQY